jgi:hypothetical protein
MGAGSASPEQERLKRLEDAIADWQKRLIDEVSDVEGGAIDSAYHDRFRETIHRLVQLNDELHPEDFDTEALAELRGILLRMVTSAENVDSDRPLDSLDDFLVQAEALRHIVRDALDGHVSGADGDAKTVMARLEEWLPNVKQKDLAALVDRSPRTLQRWSTSGRVPPRELRLVARLVALLRRGWTEQGVIAWFYRPRDDFKGRRPIDLLHDPAFEQDLLIAARQGRAQHGS